MTEQRKVVLPDDIFLEYILNHRGLFPSEWGNLVPGLRGITICLLGAVYHPNIGTQTPFVRTLVLKDNDEEWTEGQMSIDEVGGPGIYYLAQVVTVV